MSRINPDLITDTGKGNFVRLKTLAGQAGKDVKLVAGRFMLEAAIRRIFASEYADRFGVASLKGGSLMFFSEGVDLVDGRGTSDIDIQLSGYQGTMLELGEIMRLVLAQVPAIDDGVRFDLDKLAVTEREGDDGIPGGSITTKAQIGTADFTFKVDVGIYGSENVVDMEAVDYPTLLPSRLGSIRIYRQPIEHSLTDKIHAAFKHGSLNSRLRDFYDLYCYCTRCDLDDDKIRAGFSKWQTLFGVTAPDSLSCIAAYGDQYAAANAGRWKDLVARSKWALPTPSFAEVIRTIRDRIEQVMQGPEVRNAA